MKPEFSCCIGTVQIEGIDTTDLGVYLWNEHRILATPIKHEEFEGLRVTANLFTTLEELDRFVDAMERVIQKGLPSGG